MNQSEGPSWLIRKDVAQPFDSVPASIVGPSTNVVEVVPAADLDALRDAVNDYLAAQNWAGYRDGDYGHDDGCRAVRTRLCETVSRLNVCSRRTV